jgi:hypothetical protein
MLLEVLPKDILEYVLSLVVYDFYESHYTSQQFDGLSARTQREANVALLCDNRRFWCNRMSSHMANFMLNSSLIHPKIRSLLRNVSVFDAHDTWHFHERFFLTMTR